MGQSKRRKKPTPRTAPQRLVVDHLELEAVLERAKGLISEQDFSTLKAIAETLAFLTQELERKGTSIHVLRRLIFGPRSEKMAKVCPEAAGQTSDDGGSPGKQEGSGTAPGTKPGTDAPAAGEAEAPKQRKKGASHGRNGAGEYTGADRVKVSLASMQSGDSCPECLKGKVYPLKEPKVIVRVRGMAPLQATVFELERLRCNECYTIFTAPAPEGVSAEKYDETAAAMVVLFRYSAGLPFNRVEKLQECLGIPLPASTQWEVAYTASDLVQPAHDELVRQAAQAELLHNDDTPMRILDLPPMQNVDEDGDPDGKERTGVYTSGIVARKGEHTIALYFSGHQHAGENLADVLSRRAKDLDPPIHMCDALSCNTKDIKGTFLAHCLAHARRKFVEVEPNFPNEVKHLLEELGQVYHGDALAQEQGLSPQDRLRFHQQHSGPIMKKLKEWLDDLIDGKKIEPASGLGVAVKYLRKHWVPMTLFLRHPGSPLDNNICERILKKAIIHRKNSLFYKTVTGAEVGDIFMSLIHTAELNGADPFDYLVALQRHAEHVAETPGLWMPWN